MSDRAGARELPRQMRFEDLVVEEMRPEFHGAVEHFECVRQQQQFALRVQVTVLSAFAIRHTADFDAAVRRVDVHERADADCFAERVVDDGERQHRTVDLRFQAPLNFDHHVGDKQHEAPVHKSG